MSPEITPSKAPQDSQKLSDVTFPSHGSIESKQIQRTEQKTQTKDYQHDRTQIIRDTGTWSTKAAGGKVAAPSTDIDRQRQMQNEQDQQAAPVAAKKKKRELDRSVVERIQKLFGPQAAQVQNELESAVQKFREQRNAEGGSSSASATLAKDLANALKGHDTLLSLLLKSGGEPEKGIQEFLETHGQSQERKFLETANDDQILSAFADYLESARRELSGTVVVDLDRSNLEPYKALLSDLLKSKDPLSDLRAYKSKVGAAQWNQMLSQFETATGTTLAQALYDQKPVLLSSPVLTQSRIFSPPELERFASTLIERHGLTVAIGEHRVKQLQSEKAAIPARAAETRKSVMGRYQSLCNEAGITAQPLTGAEGDLVVRVRDHIHRDVDLTKCAPHTAHTKIKLDTDLLKLEDLEPRIINGRIRCSACQEKLDLDLAKTDAALNHVTREFKTAHALVLKETGYDDSAKFDAALQRGKDRYGALMASPMWRLGFSPFGVAPFSRRCDSTPPPKAVKPIGIDVNYERVEEPPLFTSKAPVTQSPSQSISGDAAQREQEWKDRQRLAANQAAELRAEQEQRAEKESRTKQDEAYQRLRDADTADRERQKREDEEEERNDDEPKILLSNDGDAVLAGKAEEIFESGMIEALEYSTFHKRSPEEYERMRSTLETQLLRGNHSNASVERMFCTLVKLGATEHKVNEIRSRLAGQTPVAQSEMVSDSIVPDNLDTGLLGTKSRAEMYRELRAGKKAEKKANSVA